MNFNIPFQIHRKESTIKSMVHHFFTDKYGTGVTASVMLVLFAYDYVPEIILSHISCMEIHHFSFIYQSF